MIASALTDNLLAAPVVAFLLAFIATLARADIRLPQGMYPVLSMYLLLAIGLKGGKGLASAQLADVWKPLLFALALGVITPLIAYGPLRWIAKLGVVDAAAIAAHYGSVSAVTFTVVQSFLDDRGVAYEGFMAGLLAILEIIGIIVALALAQRAAEADARNRWREAIAEVVRGRSIVLLLVGLLIGLIAGPDRMKPIDPLFVGLFQGLLLLFLLELGAIAALRMRDLREAGWKLAVLAIVIPIVNGSLGALAGTAAGLSVGGTTILATLAASASYIAAPAAVRIALPSARPGLYITSSLGITFPFNIIAGVPLYYAIAKALG